MDKEITALRQELALLKLQFSERVREVEQRLDRLLAKQLSEHNDSVLTNKVSIEQSLNIEAMTEKVMANEANSAHGVQDNTISVLEPSLGSSYQLDSNAQEQPNKQNKPKVSSALHLFVSFILSNLFDWLSPVVKIYHSYKERGMLGILALTVSGIALTLAGFGYLMELLIDQLGAGSKSMLMALVTVMVIGLGIILKAKPRFSEFGTAIVGLGLLLSYSTVYFTGSVYGLLPITAVLGLYFIVALLCHGLALWLDTKVIASLGVMGIALMPMLSSFTTNSDILMEPSYYLVSLILISASSLFIAFTRVGLWLAHLTLAFSIIAIEWLINTSIHSAHQGALVLGVSILYGLFFFFCASVFYQRNAIIPVDLGKLVSPDKESDRSLERDESKEQSLPKNNDAPQSTSVQANPVKTSSAQINYAVQMLVFLVASLGATLTVLFQSFDVSSIPVNAAFSLNSVIAATAAFSFYKLRHPVFYIFSSIAVVWLIFLVVSLISSAQWGIAWAVEGLLLMTIAKKYNLVEGLKVSNYRLSLINQGQILISIALLYSWAGLSIYFPLPALQSFDGWLLSVVIVVVIAIWQRMISNNEVMFDLLTRKWLKPSLQLVEVIWLVTLLISASIIWLGHWTGALVILIQFGVLFRARYCAHSGIELFAISLILLPLFYVGIGALSVDSLRFTALPTFAKLAITSVFIQLWLWSEFYRRFYKNSSLSSLAEYARIAFYFLLPICWVGSVIRRYDELALLVIWLSPLLSLFLAIKTKHLLLIKEFKWLISLASACLILGISTLDLIFSSMVLTAFIALFYVSFWLSQHSDDLRKELGNFGQKVGLFALGITIPAFIGSQLDSALAFGITAALYWATVLYLVPKSTLFQQCHKFIAVINLIILFSACIFVLTMPEFIVLPLLFFTGILVKQPYQLLTPWPKSALKANQDLVLHGLAALSYCCFLIGFSAVPLHLLIAPALAIHGALILFIKSKRVNTLKFGFALILLGILKLGLIDAANALLWQKVMLFMGLGVFILFASFAYQKLLAKAALISEE